MTAVLGIDIGGTFTDVVLARAGGQVHLGKYLTTPDRPTDGLVTGVRDLLARSGTRPSEVVRVVHATTLATNVILERRGVPVAFVTTKGFRDMLPLGRQARVEEERYDLLYDVAEPPVPRSHCFEVPERIGPGGRVVEPIDLAAARAVAERIAGLGVAAVAISFLHSYANPDHERAMAALCRELMPEVTVVASAEVWPELREYERSTTTLMSAYVGPVMSRYLAELRTRLRELGVAAPVHVMESSGGVMSVELAVRRAVQTVESGPAAGVVAAQQVGRVLGRGDLISFDMGGTTAKAGVIRGGRADVTRDFHVGGKGSFGGRRAGTGLPVKVPAIDLAEVGSGGGSIAWVDDGGALRVGPRSAGAQPGPACYGLGGEEPTVTDADLVLGYLDPAYFAGGTVALHPDRSDKALDELAGRLGVDRVAAASAVHEIANAAMGFAVHVVTVQRGIDPRRFSLVAFGGAGPMHAARIAERFDIPTVVVPYGCGVGSALGLLVTDLTTERSRTRPVPRADADPAAIEALYGELAAAALADLGEAGGAVAHREVDARYLGQAHEVTVPAPDGPVDAAALDAVVEAFHARYAEIYGRPMPSPVELVSFRVRVRRPVDALAIGGGPGADVDVDDARAAGGPGKGQRPAHFVEYAADGGYVSTPVIDRDRCPPGFRCAGPAILEEAASTVVVPPGWLAEVDGHRNVVLTRTAR